MRRQTNVFLEGGDSSRFALPIRCPGALCRSDWGAIGGPTDAKLRAEKFSDSARLCSGKNMSKIVAARQQRWETNEDYPAIRTPRVPEAKNR
jgi:hypothetical protein